ncbi:hypothetical protein SPRG_14417 [Saprolegnia parasitica CBS 223.65]|uniref:PUB domain-containing protein n=1 Tax=Saprolegnia parasitica (strain CBS 223.65) TaxID=695850 RepID=A0A067C0E9_SAPPC|nr:hypothetical protein SPRG_14417 [Saprolegnia parasitica CBS 223.65]KDO20282.1 hypothetical protein SPRG_14417 [Saprolegnia parasitica CBS 223.65]|eukprot:XP_012209020.1 hypothetical protein SPRG_14417 [Saprolegnia parasitica CBS 223.65]
MDWLKKTKAKVTEKVAKHQQEAKIKKQTFKGPGYSLQDPPPAPGPSAAAAPPPPPPPKRSANVTDEERALRRAQQAAAAQRRELPAPKKRTTFSTENDDDGDDEDDAVRSEAFEAAKMLEQLKIAESGFNPYQAMISSSTEGRGVSVGATEAKPSPPKPSSPHDELVPAATKSTLVKLLENILSNPDDVKYQKLRLSNAQIQAKIASVPMAMELLEHAGFDRVVLDDGEDYLVLNATRTSTELLQRTLETLGHTS